MKRYCSLLKDGRKNLDDETLMMKKTALIGALSLESLLGCGTEFPQYSGRCELQGVSSSDPSFVGEKQMPPTLDITDRMKYIGHHWDHRLLLEFIPNSSGQAAGIFAEELDRLTQIDNGVWPNNWYDGTEIHQEPKVYGTGAFCNYQYLYFLYLESIPPVEVLKEVYPGKGDYVGKDPVTQMELYETLPDPENVDFDDTEWSDAVEENNGITLYFTFTRYRREVRDDYKECILPADPRGEASLTFTYHTSLKDLDDETDIRKAKADEIKDDQPSILFFRKVVSGIK